MSSYAKSQAIDQSMNVVQGASTPFPALKTWAVPTAITSSVINLHPNTTRLEVGSFGGQGAVIKWIPTTDTTSASVISSTFALANFDNFIPAGTYRQFVVPRETAGVPLNANVQIGSIYGLYQRVAWISAGPTPSSIIANEY